MHKLFVLLGSLNMFLAVTLGAFGAHGLKNKLKLPTDMLAIYHTGVQYHLIHAIGLILVGILAQWMKENSMVNWAGWSILAGIVIFSGSLYILSISGIRWLGAITPIGGLAFLAGWIFLAIAALKM